MIVRLSDRKVKIVLKRLDEILDEEGIIGQEWNKEVIKALIIDNLTLNKTTELIKELEEMPISEWND